MGGHTNWRKAAAAIAAAAMLALAGTAAVRSAHADGAVMSIDPPSQNVATDAAPFTVNVKISGASNVGSWEFAIVFDTHSQDLSDDLVKSSLMLDGAGGKQLPIAWDGGAAGGHHREGVLRFNPLSPRPQFVELQITRTGEGAPRSFRWQLK